MPDKQTKKSTLMKSLRPFFVPVAMVLLILISAFLVVVPRFRETGKYKSEIAKKEKKLAQLTAKSSYLKGLNRPELKKRANYLLKVLPEKKEVPYLMTLFKKLALDNNLKLSGISTNPGQIGAGSDAEKGLPFLEFDLTFMGKIEGIKGFLLQVNKTAPLLIVGSMALSDAENIQSDELEVSVRVKTPYLYLPQELGSVESPLSEMTSEDDLVYRKIGGLEPFVAAEMLEINLPSGKQNPFGY